MKIKIILISLFLSYFFRLDAQIAKYSNEFLTIGTGADALGMAGSNVASQKSVTAGFWNPAGLNRLAGDVEISLMHSEYFAGITKFDYIGTAYKIDSNTTIGFSAIRLGVDDIPNTLDLMDKDGNFDLSRITYFSTADYAFLFSYARKSNITGLYYGGNVKMIRRITGKFANAWGFGFDIGAQYIKKSWEFGLMAKDITTTFNIWHFDEKALQVSNATDSTSNPIPDNSLELTAPTVILGTAKTFKINEKFTLLTELNLDFTFDNMRNTLIRSRYLNIDPHLGMQLQYRHFLFLRGGIRQIQEIRDFNKEKKYTLTPAIGLGVKIKNLSIDYAVTNHLIYDNFYTHIFSLKFYFNTNHSFYTKPLSNCSFKIHDCN